MSLQVIRVADGNLRILAAFRDETWVSPGRWLRETRYESLLFSPTGEFIQQNIIRVTNAVTPPMPVSFSDGSLLFAHDPVSNFDSVDGSSTPGPVLINRQGQVDSAFTAWLQDDPDRRFFQQADGRIWSFQSRTRWLARLDRDGQLSPLRLITWGYGTSNLNSRLQSDLFLVTFSDVIGRYPPADKWGGLPSARAEVYPGIARATVLADDRVLVWGSFTGVAGWRSPGVARLDPTLIPDRRFRSPLPDGFAVQAALFQPDGRILVAYGPAPGNRPPGFAELTRLTNDGATDNTFDRPVRFDGRVNGLALDNQGRILVGGGFRLANGAPCPSVARLLPDGAVDETFVRGSGSDRPVMALFVQPDDSVVAYGDFRQFDGHERWSLARLGGGTPASGSVRVIGISPSHAARLGERITLGALVSGEAPLRLQWFHGGIQLAGEANRTLLLQTVSVMDTGTYELRVSDGNGTVVSASTELAVAPDVAEPPVLAILPRRRSAAAFGLVADPNASYRLELSTDLVNWLSLPVAAEPNGFFWADDLYWQHQPMARWFYRVVANE
ncbi:MAG TPA: hypothetical protein PLX89_21780 [Verrucomicrobiota bacterium]|nr:hypothetical protein [Verrucomicrobiota bacterium]